MPRIRSIKPDFFTSLTIADLTPEQRLTFIGLWTHVDDEGLCVDDARLIKAAVWPLDDRSAADVESDLGALTDASLIVRYTVRGRRYIAVATWDEHQRINRPTPSKFPGPDEADSVPDEPVTCSDEAALIPHDALTEESVSTHDRKGTGKGTGNRDSATRDAAASGADLRPEQLLTNAVYERVDKAINYAAVMGIARWALNARHEPPQAVEDAMVRLYELGKPITKQTVGQMLDGHLDRPSAQKPNRVQQNLDVVRRRAERAGMVGAP